MRLRIFYFTHRLVDFFIGVRDCFAVQKGRRFFFNYSHLYCLLFVFVNASQFNFVCVGKVEALLQALVCAWACAACKCAYTCALACSHAVKLSASNSACFNTVSIAFCCLSGG